MCVCSDDIAIMYIDLLLYLTILLSLLTIFVEMSTYNLDSPIFTCDPKYFSTFKFNHANKLYVRVLIKLPIKNSITIFVHYARTYNLGRQILRTYINILNFKFIVRK